MRHCQSEARVCGQLWGEAHRLCALGLLRLAEVVETRRVAVFSGVAWAHMQVRCVMATGMLWPDG